MKGNDIRRTFLSFFEERGHRVVPSSSLIAPVPGLLLTNAGMNQFVPYFLGQQEPPYPRATSCQKCMRTGDIEHVGHDARHLTFFEMLGNFSFGDYFKKEAITWAHELVTKVYGIDHQRLWVTVFETDDDAAMFWGEVGIEPERIVRRGKFDAQGEPANFWWTHVAGPCGPCSEIYVDRGPEYGPDGGPDVDEERFLEIWNLVFIQDECDDQANVVRELPAKNVDTGSSLERVAMVLQDVPTAFDTDLFRPLVEVGERLSGIRYQTDDRADVSLRILAEHGRACTFMIGDGILPSNAGRGYVLRRMLRRLVMHARRLGIDKPVMGDLVRQTVETMGEQYPELVQNEALILQVAASEEERFGATYRLGMDLLAKEIDAQRATRKGSGVLPGSVAFGLHDTFGFPIESTIELAADEGLTVDTEAFARLMEEQRQRGRAAARKGAVDEALEDVAGSAGPTEFLGYERLESDGRIVGMVQDGARAESAQEGGHVRLVLDRTPFYAEGGGQIGDAGLVTTPTGVIEVSDTRPGPGGTIVLEGRIASGEVLQGQEAIAAVDAPRRQATARSHTGTHVLHHTLRQFLGEHARQAGSLVEPGRLRFDFTHYEAVPKHALEEIEYLANRRIAEDQPARAFETTAEFARSLGAIALFGEKYGDIVRVVEIGDYSIELCGGTHVHHTGEVGLLRLVSEGSIGSGFRRVEALTGPDALKQVNVERRLLEEVVAAVGGGNPNQAPERVRHVVSRIKQLESELGKVRRAEEKEMVEALLAKTRDVGGIRAVVESLGGLDASELRELALGLRNRLAHEAAAVVLAGTDSGKTTLVAALTPELVARGITAGNVLEPAARAIGGNAGGKPDLAMGGGPRSESIDEGLAATVARLQDLLAGA